MSPSIEHHERFKKDHPLTLASRPVLLPVLGQHLEEVSSLLQRRQVLLTAPHLTLYALMAADRRLAAHLDGLAEGRDEALALVKQAFCGGDDEVVFALTVHALSHQDANLLKTLVGRAQAAPAACMGLLAALGWVSASALTGVVRALLGSTVSEHRIWGLAACAMHRIDPGPILTQATRDADTRVRAQAWRTAGDLGRRDLSDAAQQLLMGPQSASPVADEQAMVCRAAAWALALWGLSDTGSAHLALTTRQPGQPLPGEDAHRLACMAAPIDWGRDQVRALANLAESNRIHKRRMLRMAGWVGDPQVMPWLIHHMADDAWSRLAGEAFCMIAGADLDKLQLYRMQPEGVDFGPTEDPEDENVAMDEDDGLMWPDALKVQDWWKANSARFTPGQRYLVGEPPSVAHCLRVLRHGYQRQRIMAAEYLCLLRPGSKLFPVAAPAWRQSRWLAEEEAAFSS
jgi:uncharacterized protein (TIGR02270 family)